METIKELIIKVDNAHIHLSPDLHIPIQDTNIPYQYCKFKTKSDIFWRVELVSYNEKDGCWTMRVADHTPTDVSNFTRQTSIRVVRGIHFEKLDWKQLHLQLSSYTKMQLRDILQDPNAETFDRGQQHEKLTPSFRFSSTLSNTDHSKLSDAQLNALIFNNPIARPYTRTHNVEFSFYFSDTRFMQGCVSFKKRVKEVGCDVEFKIVNDYTLPEFDSIKSWFAKKLGRRFRVHASVVTQDGKVTEVIASSPQIDAISSELIESIKHERTKSLSDGRKIAKTDKLLFTIDEVFQDAESGSSEGNVFKQTEQELINTLLDKHKTRNRKQLEYLSGHKQSPTSKLHFTLNPTFGFLFFIEGELNNHFVWELLNSHATYIWTIKRNSAGPTGQYEKIEGIINTIRTIGREEYKRLIRQDNGEADIIFSDIDHHDINSEETDGFVKWRLKLESKLS